MKAILIRPPFLLFFVFILTSFDDPYMIKRTSDKDFRYEFYTTDKKITPNKNKTYYWFKGGLIHEAQGGITGDLLDNKFIKMYHTNQLAEQGRFKKGVKVGVWKTWYQNGLLATVQNWNDGLRSGSYLHYDQNGILIETGRFMSNLKNGKWINVENKDTILYKKGKIIKQKETFTKSEKYRIRRDNTKLENAKETQKELEAASDAIKLADYKAKTKEENAIAKEIAKNEKEVKTGTKKIEKATKKTSREQAKNAPKKDSKIITFFKNLFKKKDKTSK